MREWAKTEARVAPGRARVHVRQVVAAEDGVTLPELLVVLAIIGIVLVAITQLFMSGLNTETDQTRRVNAQQDARVALDQLRRELHCASALSYNSASSVTVTLPSYCSSSPTTTLSAAVTLPSATIPVTATDTFNSGANTISFGSSGTVACTGKTATSFIGCSGGTAGAYPSGAAVTSPVTWCATTSGPPYLLKRYATNASVPTGACSGTGGVQRTEWLVSSSVFGSYTRPTTVVAAPTFTAAASGGRIQPGVYWYDVTAVTPNGEFSGTPTQMTVPTGSTNNTVTLSWSPYTDPSGAAATGYRIYGRDNGSTTAEGLRLLATVPTTSWTDTGPPLTTLSSNVTLPAVTIPVVSTSTFTWSPNTISFGPSGTVTCTGQTATSFTGCSGGLAGTYPSGTGVFQDRTAASPVDAVPPLATLNVLLVLDQTPANTLQRFTLSDAISLRNSGRF
ncbi:MAG TPA: type II secretion system protein [Gaiellaceae bacterium]|nr:type II secretion system protein [Gaiellaceae bacterium]